MGGGIFFKDYDLWAYPITLGGFITSTPRKANSLGMSLVGASK